MIITGLRGVGKTVLLNEFVEIARAAHWEVIEFEASTHDDSHFRQTMFSQLKVVLLRLSPRARWTDRSRRAAEVLSAFAMSIDSTGILNVSWDIPPAEGIADHGDLGMDLTGFAAFTVPDFDKFMLRVVPELVIPGIRKRRRKST